MSSEIFLNSKNIFPIAIGTWGVGGKALWDSNGTILYLPIDVDLDKEYEAIRFSIKNGMNYIDTCLKYGDAQTRSALRKAIHEFPRDTLFVTAKLDSWLKTTDDIYRELDLYLETFEIDFLDMYQIHHPMIFLSHQETIRTINKLMNRGLVKCFGVSNFNTEQLEETLYTTQYRISCCEVHYNLVIRINEQDGVIDFCNRNDIKILAYQPIRRGNIAKANYSLVRQLAQKYNKTQNQVLLNWLCSKQNFIPIVKSTNIDHINENLQSLSFKLSRDDVEQLDNFRTLEFENLDYDYWGSREDKQKRWKI